MKLPNLQFSGGMLATGSIIGIVVGGVVLLVIIAAVVTILLYRSFKNR